MRPGDRDLVAFLEEEVLPYLTVEALYSDVIFTERRGRYWRGPCPLHGGDNPTAFSVDTVTKGWTCFSHCGSGSAVAYVNGGKTPHGRDFVEAVKKLASLAGVPFPERERTAEEVKRAEAHARRETLLRAFLAHVQGNLTKDAGKTARAYLTGRGLTGTAVEDLGLFTTRADTLAALTSQGFTKDEVEASGLVHDGRWEGRLIIPWHDRWGRLGTFAARDLTGKAEEAEKYLYMTTTKWGKSKADLVAFGLDQALLKWPLFLVLVEGLLDVVNLQAHGFMNVAAIGGAGRELNERRWEALISLGVPPVVLVMDKDAAGVEGTLAAVENVRKVRNVRNVPVLYVVDPVHLGDCKDPDELARKHGVEAFRAVLEKREPPPLFVGRQFLKDVTPSSPVHVRDLAAFKVATYAETLRGERAAFHVEDLLRLTAERTGYTVPSLVDVGRRHEERRRREEAESRLTLAIQRAKVGMAQGTDPVAVAEELTKATSSMRARAADSPPLFSVERLERETKTLTAGKSSGWEALDRQEVLFNPGEFAVMAGRTGHCKTSALLGLLVNWVKDAEEKSRDEVLVFYSQEESEVRIFHRLMSRLTVEMSTPWKVNEVRDYLRGGYESRGPTYEWPSQVELQKARETLQKWEPRLFVVNRPSWTVEELVAHARDFADHHKVGAVLVDYLQRIPVEGKYDRRDIEVSAVARDLKALAVDLSVPVVAGAQINREAVPEKYREKLAKAKTYEDAEKVIKTARPLLSHLREGGAEQEADLILGLLNYAADYRADEEEDKALLVPDVSRLEVGTLKNRYGVPGRWSTLALEGRFNYIRDPKTWETELNKKP